MTWAALFLGYALGAIPFGLILARLAGAGDIRAIGSGNIGATNVLRTGRRGLAAATLALDAGKAALAVVLARAIWPEALLAPLAAVAGAWAGHLWPIWLGFRGGKGVAVALGAAWALAWPAGLGFALAWIAGVAAARRSSVGGMLGPLGAAAAAWVSGYGAVALLMLAFFLAGLWSHRDNLARLRSGTEPRIGEG